MITISPCRSAKCAGASRQPDESMNSGPPMSSASASTQRAPWSSPSANEAATSSPEPMAVLTASPMTEWRSPGSSPLATTKSTIWAIRTIA